MNSIACNIVITPNLEMARQAVQLSEWLENDHETLFTLKDGAYFPHVSLYMTQLKVADLATVSDLLCDIAVHTSLFYLEATQYAQLEGFIDVEYQRIKQLEDLQMAVINAINPIRDGMRAKDKERMLTTTGKVRESLEKYGYRSVGELYRPHLTLTRFTDLQSIDISGMPPFDRFSGKYNTLGLYEMGNNGTCVRLISEVRLHRG